jgi:hypothetical protein
MTTTIHVTPLPQTQNQPFEPQQSFVQRLLNFQIQLASEPVNNQPSIFDSTGNNTVQLSGFRASVRVQGSGKVGCTAEVMIWGLPQDLMNQLSTLGQAFNLVQKNLITIYAGSSSTFTVGVPAVPGTVTNPNPNSQAGFTPIFSGVIYLALPDYNQQPNVPMRFSCSTVGAYAIAPATPTSFPGTTDVATAMSGFARQMNVGFENNNINIKLPASYYPGTIEQQVQKLARDAHINAQVLTGAQGGTVLAIWPIGGSRTTFSGAGPLPIVGPATGMIGYPSFALNSWIVVRTVFNPQLGFGGQIMLQSSIPQINNKTVVIYGLDLVLESLVPKGKWEETAICFPLGLPAPAVPQASS